MMDYCEFFDTEEEAIAACREVNRGLNSKDPACCVVVDGPEDNYAVVDLETAKDLLDFGGEIPATVPDCHRLATACQGLAPLIY